MTKLKTILPQNRLVYSCIFLSGILLVLESYWYLLVYMPFLYYFGKNHKDLIKLTTLFCTLYFLSLLIHDNAYLKIDAQSELVVFRVSNKDDYQIIEGKIDGVLVKITNSIVLDTIPGDVYSIKGDLTVSDRSTFPYGFDYHEYLLSKGIKYTFKDPDMTYLRTKYSPHIYRYKIDQYIKQNLPHSKDYIKTFILADKSSFDQNLINDINKLGISHLFAVSGLHVGLLVLVLNFSLSKIIEKEFFLNIIIILILIGYLIITSFSPSIFRATGMFVLLKINKRYRLEYSTLDLLSLLFIILLIINPYQHYNVGFVLSFLVTFFILLSVPITKKKNYLHSLFIIGSISFLSTVPIVLSINKNMNLLTVLFNMLFVPLMSFIILPINYLTFLFPMFDYMTSRINNLFNQLVYVFSEINSFMVKGCIVHPLSVIIYYVILLYFLIKIESKTLNYKTISLFASVLVLLLNTQNINPLKEVTFLDVSGDSTFISDSFNRCNILIDTGEKDNYHSVTNFLLSKNIKRLDYIIITHFHSDHYGELEYILENVENDVIITSNNVRKHEGIPKNCGSISFYIYPLSNGNDNENNNSIVMSLLINEDHYLFTGDIEEEREKEFVNLYQLDIDILKIPHHGSSTSSTDLLIDSISPEVAVVMAKRRNRFGHPYEFVMKKYVNRNIEVYRTDEDGSISFMYLFDFQFTEVYPP